MFSGVAMALGDVPTELFDRHGLRRRVHDRGGEPEVRFLLREAVRVLAVCLAGGLRLVRGGNRRGQSRTLPCTAWAWRTTLEAGGLSEWRPEPVVIPAAVGLDRGIWFRIREGVRGVAIRD